MTAQTSKITDLETALYEQVCDNWKEAYSRLKEQESEVELLRAKLIEISGGDRMEFGVKVQQIATKCKTDWKCLALELGANIEDIERWTGMPFLSWRITKY